MEPLQSYPRAYPRQKRFPWELHILLLSPADWEGEDPEAASL